MIDKKIRVLVVDDSVLVRKYISDVIKDEPDFELIGTACNGEDALEKIKQMNPDVVTLDLIMPGMDGLKVLNKIMKESPTRTIVISSATRENEFVVLLALESGAIDFISKPVGTTEFIVTMKDDIVAKIRKSMKIDLDSLKGTRSRADRTKAETQKEPPKPEEIKVSLKSITKERAVNKGVLAEKIVAIGCSTGGPQALKELLTNTKINDKLAYVIVQHMPKEFTTMFADRLNSMGKINVKEAEDGDIIYAGMGYLAPGDAHITFQNKAGMLKIRLSRHGKVSGHMPSVDVLFDSLAKQRIANKSIAVIMTGMGSDGAKGMVALKDKGTITIAQDEKSSVVYGMNGSAVRTGSIDHEVALSKIIETINRVSGL